MNCVFVPFASFILSSRICNAMFLFSYYWCTLILYWWLYAILQKDFFACNFLYNITVSWSLWLTSFQNDLFPWWLHRSLKIYKRKSSEMRFWFIFKWNAYSSTRERKNVPKHNGMEPGNSTDPTIHFNQLKSNDKTCKITINPTFKPSEVKWKPNRL